MKKNIFIILALLMFGLIFTGLSCSKSATPTTTPTAETTTTEDLTNAAPTSIDSSFTTNYNLAKEKVIGWKPDASLAAVSVKLPANLGLNNSTETFTFGSATDTLNWWSISIAESTGKFIRAIIPKTDYLGTAPTPINVAFWKTNYLEAFQLAEANGGKDFRKNNTDVDVTLTLMNSEPKGWLWWVVDYKTPSGNSLKVRINPNDKSIVDETGTVIVPAATTTTTTQ